MALYESEYTVFIREMRAQHPEWEKEQLAGRAILWDKRIDYKEQNTFKQATLPNRSYPYDVNFD